MNQTIISKISSRITAGPHSYWLTRFVILRLLGIVYAVAFLVTIKQAMPLMGSHGLLPVHDYLMYVSKILGPTGGFFRLPSVFWFGHSDNALITAAWIGFILSCAVAIGFANAPMLAILWFLYLSFIHVGQEWYGYGWEIQLTETGFLAIFLCPLVDARPFPKQAPPTVIIVLFRWLVFRIMLGAGLIKIRGDEIWRNGTALFKHFETQPLPGPLSRWFHFLPHAVLKTGVWFNHLAELIAPWFAFGPRIARQTAGIVMILLQIILILSGNLSFLNWLTIIPALACFDDAAWAKLLPRQLTERAKRARETSINSRPMRTMAWVVATLVAVLSIAPVTNLLSPRQVMNTSFDPFDLVNTYGAFGTVSQERYNVVFEGTNDTIAGRESVWKPYIYKGLPVLLDRRPPQMAPYHLRFDWAMWFAAMSAPQEYPWTVTLVEKLLQGDKSAISLFAADPFAGTPPKYIRAIRYRYWFAKPGNSEHRWWERSPVDVWLPPMAADAGPKP